MYWIFFILLMIMWWQGMVSSFTMGGFVQILLILTIAAILFRIIQGQKL